MVGKVPWPEPICLAEPQPGDFVCVPIPGDVGKGIEIAQWISGDELKPYDHAEVYVGQPDKDGPYGYTYSAYPSNGKNGLTGKRALSCPPAQVPGSLWSSGILEPSLSQREGIVAWCVAHADVGYSYLDYGALTMHTLHIPAPGLRDYIKSTAHMICSQYTDSAWNFGGTYHLFDDGRWPGFVKPGDLASLLLVTKAQKTRQARRK